MQPTLTDTPAASQWTETLANLNILWILGIIAALSVLRLAFVYSKSDTARSISEILESGMIAVALVFLIIRPFVLQAFFIPSPSMEPTLLGNNGSGDRILVNKFGYRFGRPSHDDVVVFLAPPAATVGIEPDSEFIKRLIGLPGDRLEVVAGRLSVNGIMHNHEDVRQKLVDAGDCGEEARADTGSDLQASCHVKFVDTGVLAVDNAHHVNVISKERLAELYTGQKDMPVSIRPGYTIRNGEKLDEPFIAEDPDYDMKIYQGEPLKHEYGPYQEDYKWQGKMITEDQYVKEDILPTEPLPSAEYMMMGDNRNDSNDSTNWGPLAAHRLVGRAQLIFWPPSRVGIIR
ncbi:MAG: signal peptidase I [Janthinobacterium lividum]